MIPFSRPDVSKAFREANPHLFAGTDAASKSTNQVPTKSRLAVQFEDAWAAMESAPKYVTEMRVHPDRLFRYDYCWPDERVALELQGGIFRVYEKGKGGGHGTPKQFRSDCDKLNLSNLQGMTLFKLATGQITVENVAMIRDFLISRRMQA